MGAGHLGTVEFHSATALSICDGQHKGAGAASTCRNAGSSGGIHQGIFAVDAHRQAKYIRKPYSTRSAYITREEISLSIWLARLKRPVRGEWRRLCNEFGAGPGTLCATDYPILCCAARARFLRGHTRGGRIPGTYCWNSANSRND